VRVLVVDDEPRYRVYLSAKLDRVGHEVAVAENGRQAIERGIHFRPNVLVSDWMLRNHVHGLAVADALRSVDPQLPTILMTGFPSRDLRAQAREARIFQFLEKPFDLADLVAAVDRAGWVQSRPRGSAPFGVLVLDREDLVVHVSRHGRRMLASTDAGEGARQLDEILADDSRAKLDRPGGDWVFVAPIATRRVRWWVRARRWQDGGVVVILPERKRFLRTDPRVRLLLDLPRPPAVVRVPESKVLVVDPTPIGNTRYVEQFERIGCVCYKAEGPELALRLFREDPEIGIVIVDHDTPDLDLASLAEAMRAIRPHVEIVGASTALQHEVDFASAGVGRFLHRPWRIGDLLHVLEETPQGE
jgi:DNA-binding response OmpR family regulator